MLAYFRRLIDKIEDTRVPFLYYLLTFIASVTLRNFLEIFSNHCQVPLALFQYTNNIYFY